VSTLIQPDEFAAQAARARRWYITLALALLLFTPLAPALSSLLAQLWGVAAGWLTAAFVFVAVFLCAGAMFWVRRNVRSLRCPHCRAPLTQQPQLVVATGNCCFCGRRALGQPSESAAAPGLNREEFDRCAVAHANRAVGLALGVLVATFACLGAYAAGRGALVAWLGQSMPEFAAELTSLTFPGAVIVAILWFYLRQSRRGLQDPRTMCPHCGKPLLFGCRITGHCGHCGRQAVVETTRATTDETAPLRDFEEFRAASAYYYGPGMVKTLALSLGGLITGALLSLAVVLLSGLHDQETASTFSTPARVAVGLVAFVPFALGFVWFFGVLVRLERRTAADTRLQCPACRAGLVRTPAVVIATRHCPKCRRRILAEPSVA
jgi:predicted amidophosphoribosyltransferase